MKKIIELLNKKNIKYKLTQEYSDIDDSVMLFDNTFDERWFWYLLNRFIFVRHIDGVFFCSNVYAYIDNDIFKIQKVFNKKYAQTCARKIIVNGFVIRFASMKKVNNVIHTFNKVKTNSYLKSYFDFNVIKIDKNTIKETYVK